LKNPISGAQLARQIKAAPIEIEAAGLIHHII
jgi:hypothetical protein